MINYIISDEYNDAVKTKTIIENYMMNFDIEVKYHLFSINDNFKEKIKSIKGFKVFILKDDIKRLGGTPICYRTGASYTQARTKELNLPFGGEFSGHVYFRDKVADMNSGIYAGLRMIEILSNTSSKLTDLTKDIPKYYATEEIKIPTDNAIKFQVIERIKELCEKQNYNLNTIDGVRINFTNGWGLVRASNTGPNITIRCESVDEKAMNDLKDWLIKLVNTYSNELKK